MSQSNADVYASFGVNSAVVGGSTPEEHEQAMLELNVDARDGDDAIEVSNQDDPYGNPDKFAEEGDEEVTQVRINLDGDDEQSDPEVDIEDHSGDSEETIESDEQESEGSDPEFTPMGDTPAELVDSSEQLAQHEAGFQEMVTQAAERGLSEDSIARIQQEYQEDGLSDATYEELAAAGYSKGFVDSYIKGQEALVNSYVNSVIEFAGGKPQFDSIYKHLESSNPDAAKSLISALENRDLATVKTIINLAGASRSKAFGKPAERSLTKRAVQSAPVVKKAEGFASRDEMIKAMSDSRYRTDAKFRSEVESKLGASDF